MATNGEIRWVGVLKDGSVTGSKQQRFSTSPLARRSQPTVKRIWSAHAGRRFQPSASPFSPAKQREKRAEADLPPLVAKRLEYLKGHPSEPSFLDTIPSGGKMTARDMFEKFQHDLMSSSSEAGDPDRNHGTINSRTFETLRQAYIHNDTVGLDVQLKFVFQGYMANADFTTFDLLNQSKLADLRFPVEWYPGTRQMQRTIHLHVGPTNSGKTYHALRRLEQAESGIYAGPLRLLAHEVYSRLNAKGKPCNLITGDERISTGDTDGPVMSSCTVEMVPINAKVDVAVIDEIQMIGHRERGWAWTQALLGVMAREVHICGEERAVPLVRELAAAMGEKLEVHQYERLSPLRTMTTSLHGDLKHLRQGDCVVVFSRVAIHALKQEIENTTGKRVAVVYGSLPPETRAQQARLFNEPDNDYDILVASDAIGMGLNL